jgi:pilus assembly protein CpaF
VFAKDGVREIGKDFEEKERQIRIRLMEQLETSGNVSDEAIRDLIDRLVLTEGKDLSIDQMVAMSADLFASVRKLDILQELADDDRVTEIMVNGPDRIFYEKDGRIHRWPRSFSSPEKLEDVMQQIVGRCNRVINASCPIADARLADGSRVNAVIAPAALNGPILTIRKFPKESVTMERLVGWGSIPKEAADFLTLLARSRYSMIIGGGTSAGKTTFLNALSEYIPKEERIITIEDNAELNLQDIPNLVRLEAKKANMEDAAEVTIRDLIRSALRMRPDRIIVGEVRGGEAVDMLQAFNTGHDGSLCTIHANSCYDMLSRLETMVLMALPLPLEAIRRQIASGVDVLIHLGRLADHSRRVLEISEVRGMKDREVSLSPIYRWNDEAEALEKVGDLYDHRKLIRNGR